MVWQASATAAVLSRSSQQSPERCNFVAISRPVVINGLGGPRPQAIQRGNKKYCSVESLHRTRQGGPVRSRDIDPKDQKDPDTNPSIAMRAVPDWMGACLGRGGKSLAEI